VKQVWEGNAELAKGFNPPSTLGSFAGNIKGGAPFDPDGAKRILDELGWRAGNDGVRSKDGRRLELTLVNGFPSAEVHRPIPEVIQSQLAKIGIAVKIVETTAYDDTLAKMQGHLWIESGNYNIADPNFFVGLLYRSEAGGNVGSAYGKAFGIGGRVDELANQAAAEPSVEKTQQLVAEAWQIMIDQQFVVIPIAGLYNIWATSAKVSGFKPHPAFVHQSFAGVAKNA
jgi:peptide/nickel transport system substrate-binding protein